MEASSTDKRIDGLADRVGRFEGRFERFEDKFDARLASWGKIVGGGVVAALGAIVSAVILKLFDV